MDGYDRGTIAGIAKEGYKIIGYRVYTLVGKVKQYHYGYKTFKDMVTNHPELHDVSMIKALPLLNNTA